MTRTVDLHLKSYGSKRRTGKARMSRRDIALLTTMSTALALVTGAVAALNAAIPDVASALSASQTQVTWIVSAYSLVFAALLLPAGALAQKFGNRPILIIGLLVFAAASVAAALSQDPGTLIAFRAVAGIGAALVMPVTLVVVTTAFDPKLRDQAVSTWAAVAGGGALLGLLMAGALLEAFSWRSVFWAFAGLAVAVTPICWKITPASERENGTVDALGAALAVAALGGLVYGLTEGPDRGWSSALPITGFIVFAVAVIAFIAWELHTPQPMLDVRLFRSRHLTAGGVFTMLQFLSLFGMFLVVIQYLQYVRGYSPLMSAVALIPLPVALAPGSAVSTRAIHRLGERNTAVTGAVIVAAGFFVIAAEKQNGSYWLIALGLVLLGFGFGLSSLPATNLILDGLPADRQAVASGLNNAAREVGGAIGIAVFATALNSRYRSGTAPLHHQLPSPAADAVHSGIGGAQKVAAMLGPRGDGILDTARHAFFNGYTEAMWIGGAIVIAAAVLTASLVARRTTGDSPDATRQDGADGATDVGDVVERHY